ncbi:AMP-dependent synthetase [Microbacterium sp. CSI-V]|uniref:AMP-binding protein n=1 Tax=unclassified Microbacterium TaxID=2609290 RepID=UPI00097BD578|nr:MULTISPECIES: AMP-binding protein [unclassified Microbacterium]MXS74384.1 AMP-dependent synthetase [Microbacterium sp. TL13]ONI62991.1 AMP-dependent synthetase [Microbacterium sp. CSI-V]
MTSTTPTELYRAARDLLLAARTDPARAASFSWPRFEGPFNWAIDWFDPMARGNHGAALVVVDDDETHHERTFDELARRSDQLAAWLASRGVRKGHAVLLMLGNQVELWESMLAIMKLGGVIAPTTTALGPGDLADRIERAEIRHVIVGSSDADKFDDLPEGLGRIIVGGTHPGWVSYDDAFAQDAEPARHPGTTADDRLLLYFTSGTTSKPKLVEHTHASYPVGHLSTMYWLGIEPGDVHLAISSPGWAKHAWSCFFAPWIAGATVLALNYSRFSAERLLAELERDRVTTFCAPPTVWRMLIQADLTGRRGALREVVSAGEPLNPEVIAHVQRAWGLDIRDGYGQTEMTAIVANTPGADLVPGSMGRPLPGCPVVIVDPLTGEFADEGEICLDLTERPLNLMTGYVGDPARNADAFADGLFHTGDVARRDETGSITYIGRTDDVFKSSDYKISPFELESVLIEHPAVVEAAVVPAPDALRLSVPKAYVVLASGHEPGEEVALEILRFARENLAPFQRLRRIEFAELPKTISGKIRRVELREREERAARGEVVVVEWRDDSLRG